MVDTIVCEVTDVHRGICPVPGATEKMPTSTIPVHQTSHIWPTATQSFVTENTSSEYTSVGFMHPSKETLSEMKAVPNLWIVAAIASSVVVTIAIILLSYLLIRRKQRRTKPGYEKPVDKVVYQDYVAEDVHEYAIHNAVVKNQKTTADEVVYQDVKGNNEYLYHNTAVEVVYHDTAVEVVYQNSAVDRGKRTGNRKGISHAMVGGQTSPSCSSKSFSHKDSGRFQKVFIGSEESGKGSVVQFSEDYSEIDA
ncbi:uncharacterized protein LOC117119953 [Anneissia japonica]|uniref:uncharacterized protein LOC117119953 n=1 Tax=Anneissia japonica TaxID=1529436 RepID=UPI001425915F|nr:uncharacterized protein LOC117119953 [Anneissia japonica]